jgi:hypothetical protein
MQTERDLQREVTKPRPPRFNIKVRRPWDEWADPADQWTDADKLSEETLLKELERMQK